MRLTASSTDLTLVISELQNIKKDFRPVVSDVFVEVVRDIREKAKAGARVKTGRMRNSVRVVRPGTNNVVRKGDLQAELAHVDLTIGGMSVPYGHLHEQPPPWYPGVPHLGPAATLFVPEMQKRGVRALDDMIRKHLR